MRFCDNCGAGNPDSANKCVSCGAALPAAEGAPVSRPENADVVMPSGKSGSWKKLAAIALAAVVLVGGIAAAVVLGSDERKLGSAVQEAGSGVAGFLEEEPLLEQFGDTYQELVDRGVYDLTLTYSMGGKQVSTEMNYARSKKRLDGQLRYLDSSTALELNYTADKNQLVLAMPQNALNVYGFTWKDLSRKYEESFLSDVIPIKLPENGAPEIFRQIDLKGWLAEYGGDAYDELLSSFKVNDQGKRTISLAGEMVECDAYQAVWSSKALTKLIAKLELTGLLSGVNTLVEGLIPEMEPDCMLYVSDGCLVCADFVSLGNEYTLTLEGEENPWDKCVLTVKSLYAETKVYTFNTHEEGEQVVFSLESDADRLMAVSFHRGNGEFSLELKGEKLVWGRLSSGADFAAVELNWQLKDGTECCLSWELRATEDVPGKVTQGYIDLLDMSLTEWQRLLLDLNLQIPAFD